MSSSFVNKLRLPRDMGIDIGIGPQFLHTQHWIYICNRVVCNGVYAHISMTFDFVFNHDITDKPKKTIGYTQIYGISISKNPHWKSCHKIKMDMADGSHYLGTPPNSVAMVKKQKL